MFVIGNEWFLFLTFLKLAVSTRECCPPNTYLIDKSRTLRCSDNNTLYNLSCNFGVFLLDPNANENDKFSVVSSTGVLVFDDDERTEDKFCLGKIQRNGTEISADMVALVCFEDDVGSEESDVISIILRLLMLISTLFLLITLYIYIILPNLRDLQGKCVIAFICSLIASYITLFVMQTFSNSSQEVCVVQATALYFFLTATFFWNNIITFNIWKAVRNAPLKIEEKSWYVIYMAWGLGVPLIMVLLSFILENVPGGNHIRPHFAETRCWFRGKLETWSYFYGPVLILLILNTIMFLHCSWKLWKSYRGMNVSRIRSLRFKSVMYLKLFLLMGISWIFEIVSHALKHHSGTKYLWFLTDCLNSSQGILIFLILVVFRQKVRLGLLNKKLFNIKWPESWAKEVQESSTILSGEEVELANQKIKMVVEP